MIYCRELCSFNEIKDHYDHIKSNPGYQAASSICCSIESKEEYFLAQNQTLSLSFFRQIDMLRNSCNDFEGIQKKLSALMVSQGPHNKDIMQLTTMLEYLAPSYSLDILTILIISLRDHGNACKQTLSLDLF
jgi:hypothetical protein